MRIEKDNIVIRSANVNDSLQLKKWWNDGKVMEHAGFPNGLGVSIESIIDSIKNNEERLSQLCIIEIDCKLAGELSYSIRGNGLANAGWKICDFTYQNQGYGTKIIIMLLEFIFMDKNINSQFPIERIAWDTMVENERAKHIYKTKVGAKETRFRENTWKDQVGNWRSVVDYEIKREEFFLFHQNI